MVFLSRQRSLPTTRACRAPLCSDTIPSCTVDYAVTKTHGGIKSRPSEGVQMWDCCGYLYGKQETLEYQQRKTRRRVPTSALMLISPVGKPPAGGTAGTRKCHANFTPPNSGVRTPGVLRDCPARARCPIGEGGCGCCGARRHDRCPRHQWCGANGVGDATSRFTGVPCGMTDN